MTPYPLPEGREDAHERTEKTIPSPNSIRCGIRRRKRKNLPEYQKLFVVFVRIIQVLLASCQHARAKRRTDENSATLPVRHDRAVVSWGWMRVCAQRPVFRKAASDAGAGTARRRKPRFQGTSARRKHDFSRGRSAWYSAKRRRMRVRAQPANVNRVSKGPPPAGNMISAACAAPGIPLCGVGCGCGHSPPT